MDHSSSVAKQHYDQDRAKRIANAKEGLAIQNREKEFPDLGEHSDEVRASRLKREADFKEMSLAAAEKVITESKLNQSGKRYMQVLARPSATDIPTNFRNNYSSLQNLKLTLQEQDDIARLLTSKPEKPSSAVFVPGNRTAPSAQKFAHFFYRLLDSEDLEVADRKELARMEERVFSEVTHCQL